MIDSDDSDGGTIYEPFDKPIHVNKIDEDDDIPKTKDKDSKTKPVAKNRMAVKRPGEELPCDGVKITKIGDKKDDQTIVSPVLRLKLFFLMLVNVAGKSVQ